MGAQEAAIATLVAAGAPGLMENLSPVMLSAAFQYLKEAYKKESDFLHKQIVVEQGWTFSNQERRDLDYMLEGNSSL